MLALLGEGERVVLLGNAVYCPSLFSRMRRSVAIIEAYILAGEIGRHENYKDAFSYQRLREENGAFIKY